MSVTTSQSTLFLSDFPIVSLDFKFSGVDQKCLQSSYFIREKILSVPVVTHSHLSCDERDTSVVFNILSESRNLTFSFFFFCWVCGVWNCMHKKLENFKWGKVMLVWVWSVTLKLGLLHIFHIFSRSIETSNVVNGFSFRFYRASAFLRTRKLIILYIEFEL